MNYCIYIIFSTKISVDISRDYLFYKIFIASKEILLKFRVCCSIFKILWRS